MKKEVICPCGQYEYTLTWTQEDEGSPESYCAFCGILLEDEESPPDEDGELDLDE